MPITLQFDAMLQAQCRANARADVATGKVRGPYLRARPNAASESDVCGAIGLKR